MPRAFEAFGEATMFEWCSRGFDESAPDWLARRDSMNGAMLTVFHEANQRRPVDAGQPEGAEAIRQASRARCLRDHTYEARWTKVLTLAGIPEG